MQFLLLIHGDAKSSPTQDEWTTFFSLAEASGMFRGGSELGSRELIGDKGSASSSAYVAGFMRFDADEHAALLNLLGSHPVVLHGGTVELYEMPMSSGTDARRHRGD